MGANYDTFPETYGCKSLRETYNVLLEKYGDQNNQAGSGENGSEASQNALQGASGSKDDSDTTSDDKSASEASEMAQNGTTSDEEQANPNGQSSSLEKLSPRQREAFDNLTPQEHIFNTDDDLFESVSEANKHKQLNVSSLANVVYDRWNEKNLKKQFRKLRGAIEGKVSRRKRKTFARPNHRPIADSTLIKKGVAKDLCGHPSILVAIDMSGSMDSTTLETMLMTVANVFDDLGRPTKKCWVCIFNDDVSIYVPLRHYKKILGKYEPKNGTNYAAVLELANQLDVDVVLEVGDGEQNVYARNGKAGQELKKFMEAKRRWYDILVQKDGTDFAFTYHIIPDIITRGVARYVISTTPNTSRTAHECVVRDPRLKKYLL